MVEGIDPRAPWVIGDRTLLGNAAKGVFVTGTDTGCGKTLVSLALMARFRRRGWRVAGMKPVASGAEPTDAGLRNEDALRLQARASRPPAYESVNPVVFAAPIAPHIAAERRGEKGVPPLPIVAAFQGLLSEFDRIVVEGIGGWRVPLGPGGWDVAALAGRLGLPVILVVGMRLGCLNHALLTAESITRCGVTLLGWVGSVVDPGMAELEANVEALRERLPVPCFGVIPWLSPESSEDTADFLDWPTIVPD